MYRWRTNKLNFCEKMWFSKWENNFVFQLNEARHLRFLQNEWTKLGLFVKYFLVKILFYKDVHTYAHQLKKISKTSFQNL